MGSLNISIKFYKITTAVAAKTTEYRQLQNIANLFLNCFKLVVTDQKQLSREARNQAL